MKKVVGTFEIPEELSKRLSELLTKKAIREQVLVSVANDPDKYDAMEEKLIPIINEIDSIKNTITIKNVPAEFRDERFEWSYNGYDISKNVCEVYEEIR